MSIDSRLVELGIIDVGAVDIGLTATLTFKVDSSSLKNFESKFKNFADGEVFSTTNNAFLSLKKASGVPYSQFDAMATSILRRYRNFNTKAEST